MADDGQHEEKQGELLSRRGFKRYDRNPSVPPQGLQETRMRPVAIPGGEKRMVIVDGGTGELVGQGVRHFMEFEEVDATRFVKLYLEGMKQAAGLTKAGLAVFEIVYRMLQDRPNKDEIGLSYAVARRIVPDLNERTYRRGMRELIEREFLFESLVDGVYYVNIRYMFNGDRLTFVKGYRIKGAPRAYQVELPLDTPPALPGPSQEDPPLS